MVEAVYHREAAQAQLVGGEQWLILDSLQMVTGGLLLADGRRWWVVVDGWRLVGGGFGWQLVGSGWWWMAGSWWVVGGGCHLAGGGWCVMVGS